MVRKQHISHNKELLLNNDDSSTSSSNISNKSKIRYLMIRSENYEKQIATLLQSLSLYTRRMAKLRDAGDTIAETLNTISNAEVLNPSSKKAVSEVSKTFRIIQDHRDSEILYLEDKLLPLISEYGEQLQKQREELRSNVGKLFDNNQQRGSGLSWIRSSNNSNQSISRRRRSQSVERFGKGKEEKSVQQSIQRYELRKNLIFKKLLLKLVLTESRFTIRSFNNLTFCYKHILDEMNPTKDLKFFNEFFKFRSIKKSTLDEMQTVNLNGLVSDNEEEDEDDDDEDSGNDYEEQNDLNVDDNNQEDSISIKSEKNVSTTRIGKNKEIDNENDDDDDDAKSLTTKMKSSTVSTLKRFNSTPEISQRSKSESLKDINQKKINKNNNDNNNKKRIHLFGKSTMVQKKDQTTLDRKMIKKNSKSSSSNSDDNDDEDSDSDLNSDTDSDSDTENDIIDEQLDSTISNNSNNKKQQQKSMALKSKNKK